MEQISTLITTIADSDRLKWDLDYEIETRLREICEKTGIRFIHRHLMWWGVWEWRRWLGGAPLHHYWLLRHIEGVSYEWLMFFHGSRAAGGNLNIGGMYSRFAVSKDQLWTYLDGYVDGYLARGS